MTVEIKASDIAAMLKKPLIGKDIGLDKVAAITKSSQRALMFATRYSESLCETLNECTSCFVIANEEYAGRLQISHTLSPNPRLDFALAAQRFFSPKPDEGISPLAALHPTAKIGKGVFIGPFSVIGAEAEIGEGTQIASHVVISAKVKIGRHCLIKSGAVIGEKGFGFEYDENRLPVALPHFASVQVGDFVELGSHCTIVRGTLADTVIADHVKIDDHVFIAHNVSIGKASLIIACAEISGSVRIGNNVWIGPNSAIKNGIEIGADTLVGIGSTVIRNVENGKVVAGNPARILDSQKKD